MSKGSTRRPQLVSRDTFDANYERALGPRWLVRSQCDGDRWRPVTAEEYRALHGDPTKEAQ